jgi:hypothetical protein
MGRAEIESARLLFVRAVCGSAKSAEAPGRKQFGCMMHAVLELRRNPPLEEIA